MTVSSADAANRWAYTGDGSTTAFAYESRIFDSSDLKIYVNGAAMSAGSDYEVTGVDVPTGGTVSFAVPPAEGATVVLVREVPATQALDLAALGSFPAEENEKALDRLTVLVQQLLDGQQRSLRQPDVDAGNIGALPAKAARAGKVLAFDTDGDPTDASATVLPTGLTALHIPRANAAGTEYELRSPVQTRSDLGADNATNLTSGTLDMARVANGSMTAAKLADGAVVTHLGYTPLNKAGDTMIGGLNMQAAITLSADPLAAMHAATKQYVDGIAAGLGKRATVRAATTAALDLSADLEDGDALDGVTLIAGDFVLVKNQAAMAENGVYVVSTSGAAARATLFDAWAELPGSLVAVQEGNTQADTLWLCTANSGGILGTTAVTWASVFPGAGAR